MCVIIHIVSRMFTALAEAQAYTRTSLHSHFISCIRLICPATSLSHLSVRSALLSRAVNVFSEVEFSPPRYFAESCAFSLSCFPLSAFLLFLLYSPNIISSISLTCFLALISLFHHTLRFCTCVSVHMQGNRTPLLPALSTANCRALLQKSPNQPGSSTKYLIIQAPTS